MANRRTLTIEIDDIQGVTEVHDGEKIVSRITAYPLQESHLLEVYEPIPDTLRVQSRNLGVKKTLDLYLGVEPHV